MSMDITFHETINFFSVSQSSSQEELYLVESFSSFIPISSFLYDSGTGGMGEKVLKV